jgi:hypothetical protein
MVTSVILRTREMAAKEWSAVHCTICLEKRKKCYPDELCAVVEIKGVALRHENSIISVPVVFVIYCDRTGTLQSMS